MSDKPHLVLSWHFDCNTKELSCSLANGKCVYYAHQGGLEGYTKVYQGEETHVSADHWQTFEKEWISEQWGEIYGYFQPDVTREAVDPKTGRLENRQNGLGRNGEYLDHMQRSQLQLEGGDMSWINEGNDTNVLMPVPQFHTPDGGITVYKLLPTNDTYYNGHHNKEAEDGVWAMVPQPCMMQPRSMGYILSNYEEMALAGIDSATIEKCKQGLWDKPPYPKLRNQYTYPTENEMPLTVENLHNVY